MPGTISLAASSLDAGLLLQNGGGVSASAPKIFDCLEIDPNIGRTQALRARRC
jgi:hypothetical protein